VQKFWGQPRLKGGTLGGARGVGSGRRKGTAKAGGVGRGSLGQKGTRSRRCRNNELAQRGEKRVKKGTHNPRAHEVSLPLD